MSYLGYSAYQLMSNEQNYWIQGLRMTDSNILPKTRDKIGRFSNKIINSSLPNTVRCYTKPAVLCLSTISNSHFLIILVDLHCFQFFYIFFIIHPSCFKPPQGLSEVSTLYPHPHTLFPQLASAAPTPFSCNHSPFSSWVTF